MNSIFPTEHHFQCPYCWQEISFVIEALETTQEYIEDCEVCCRPIKVRFSIDAEQDLNFEALSINE